MIEIKKQTSLNLNKYQVVLDDVTLNAGPGVNSYFFGAQPILFITLQNNAGVDFNNFTVQDKSNNDLTHNAQVHNGAYSIAFSATSSGQPLQVPILTDLTVILFNWAFPGLAVGSLTINIYTFAI